MRAGVVEAVERSSSFPADAISSDLDIPEFSFAYNWAWIVASISPMLMLEAASFAAASILAYGEFFAASRAAASARSSSFFFLESSSASS
jgi:hypothetical protein